MRRDELIRRVEEIDRLLSLAQHGKGSQAWGAISQARQAVRDLLEEELGQHWDRFDREAFAREQRRGPTA